jgi:hypothetical protein
VVTGEPATSAGHLFLAIPCLDAGGLPVKAECAHDVGSRSWASCTASGCHGDATAAVSAFTLSAQRLDQLTKQIWDDVNGNDAIDPDSTACSAGARRIRVGAVTDTVPCSNPTLPGSDPDDAENRANWDAGLLARTDIIPTITGIPTISDTNQYVTNDATITPAEGARFNVRMLREGGADGSSGVHNPFLAEALLRATIDELQAEYPGLPALSASIQTIMRGPLGAVTKRPLIRPLITRPISSR